MDDLRTLLRDKAEEMRLDSEMPAGLKTRARRRRIQTATLSAVVVAGLAMAALAGADQLLQERLGLRPAEDVPSADQTLPIWPSIGVGADAAAIDAIQEQVDLGHQPWYLSPEIVAQVFAMEVMEWKRTEVETSVRGDDPVQVVISNPTLAAEADAPSDIRTILTMERWRGREDGIFVITRAATDVLDLRSPTPGQDVRGVTELTFAGSAHVYGPGSEEPLFITVNIGGASSFAPGDLPAGTGDEPPGFFSFEPAVKPSADGEFETNQAMPEAAPAPGISVFVVIPQGKLAVEAFRLGPPVQLPPPPTETEVLPDPVAATRDAVLLAANDRDWEGLEAHIDPNMFEFSFGGDHDPIRFWKRLEREGTPVREILATLLSYPATEYSGLYMWPAAATKEPKDWTEADLDPLTRIYTEKELEQIRASDMYYGWRVGIEPNGDWIFFIAGD